MLDEYNALIKNEMWVLVSRPANVNIVRSMLLFKHKFHADGSLSRYKARHVAKGCSQQHVSRAWPIHQLDVKNAFLHGHFSETVYIHHPPGFANPVHPDYVCHLQRLLYGLKQAPGAWTPVDTESKLGPDGDPVSDSTLFVSICKILVSLVLKRIRWYVRGTLDHGLQLHVSTTTQLTPYTDADWAGCPVTRRSTSGYCVFLRDNLLSWSAKRQVTLSRSSAEAEYTGVANLVTETAWISNLLLELHAPLHTATLVYCDNVCAVYLSTNLIWTFLMIVVQLRQKKWFTDSFEGLYNVYYTKYGNPTTTESSSGGGGSSSRASHGNQVTSLLRRLKEHNNKKARSDPSLSSEYERYVHSDFVTHLQTTKFETFGVLGFWKVKETMFLVLSRMAMDILSVQATSVAFESTFLTSGRVLSIRRTRLTPASLKMYFEEEILDAGVQANEAIPLSDEEIAFDAASSESSMSGSGSRGEEAEVETNYGYDIYHDDY
nr:ribonuclease H-like domain-containing protein [Tanacetum cinerariifolium]